MLEKRQVHALPTEKRSNLTFARQYLRWRIVGDHYPTPSKQDETYHHLYFTSDEEIKGDNIWCIERGKTLVFWSSDLTKNTASYYDECRKVIATTNSELWYQCNHCGKSKTNHSGLCPSCGKFGTKEVGIHKIPTDFIGAFVKEQGIWEVNLEYEDCGTEDDSVLGIRNVTENCSQPFSIGYRLKLNNKGQVIIHKVKEKMYTRQEIIDIVTKERERAIKIAYEFHNQNMVMYENRKKAEDQLNVRNGTAFILEKIANECRLVGNAISGGNALSATLGYTTKDHVKEWLDKEFPQ